MANMAARQVKKRTHTHRQIYIYMVPPPKSLPFSWAKEVYIYIYIWYPPQDPYFLRIYWYLRYFVAFYYV